MRFAFLYVGISAVAIGFSAGAFYLTTHILPSKGSDRPKIRNGQSLAAVDANFEGKPAKIGVQLSEAPGWVCDSYVQDADPTHPSPGTYFILYCSPAQ